MILKYVRVSYHAGKVFPPEKGVASDTSSLIWDDFSNESVKLRVSLEELRG
jgi:hypothetical protein